MKDIVQLESAFSNYLDKDEKILWIGQPKQGFVFKSTDLFILPFLSIWIIGIIFVLLSSDFFPFDGFMTTWLFCAATLVISFLFARVWGDIYKRKKAMYALTNKRAIIKAGIVSQEISSYDLSTLININYNEKGNGSGTITFGDPPINFWTLRGTNRPLFEDCKETPDFQYIMDVRTVYTILMDARNNLK